MVQNYQIKMGSYFITVEIVDGCGEILSNLRSNPVVDSIDVAYNNCIDALESLILGHACAGIDITSDEYKEGIVTALDAIDNNVN